MFFFHDFIIFASLEQVQNLIIHSNHHYYEKNYKTIYSIYCIGYNAGIFFLGYSLRLHGG